VGWGSGSLVCAPIRLHLLNTRKSKIKIIKNSKMAMAGGWFGGKTERGLEIQARRENRG